MRGAIAAGHSDTARAASLMLQAGGNAFDAAMAALCAACVAEPVLASLGGGGFLLAHAQDRDPLLYDFFVHTPLRKRESGEVDFRPIWADFGDTRQEFHIGLGAMATPGMIKGLFQIQRDLCRLPMQTLIQPAVELAREGVSINPLQHYISTVVSPILRATPEAFALHHPEGDDSRLAEVGERVPMTDFADYLENLAREGEQAFYHGHLGERLARFCQQEGGHLDQADLANYQVIRRDPLDLRYRHARLLSNPPPSLGGLLIGLSLGQLAKTPVPPRPWGEEAHLRWIAHAMRDTQDMRKSLRLQERAHQLSGATDDTAALLREYEDLRGKHPMSPRGTTHVSIMDQAGNLASMTLSNGEGCGRVLPDSGIMLNNMLGEEDLNPDGFHRWPENRRMSSMMAPSALELEDGTRIATGSGGSNRIRSAILQVLVNLLDYNMDVKQAVEAARIHLEGTQLHLEPPSRSSALRNLREDYPNQCAWTGNNLFFGGAHTVMRSANGDISGAGDPRRGGVFVSVDQAGSE